MNPEQTTINWGILGTGTIAAALARALAQTPDNQLAAVASRDATRVESFAQQQGAARAHPSYEALLADGSVDVVYVATPHPQHVEWAVRALRAGKAVLCEKPLGLNHAQVMLMTDTALEAQRFLMEAFMYRCHPQTQRMLALIADGAIGEVRHIEASFGYQASFNAQSRLFANDLAGGGIMDVGCYPVSMARLLAGAEPIDIAAHGKLGRTGVDEWTAALLKFDNGVSAQVATAVSVNLANELNVYGERGRLRLTNPWLCADAQGNWQFEILRNGRDPEVVSGQALPLYRLEVAHVAECLRHGALQSPLMSWTDSWGNALAMDRWRAAIGLQFDQETPQHLPGPVTGAPLSRRANAQIQTARIAGVAKPAARLVMGCDNQPSMSHAAIMWDHYFEQGGNAFDTAYIYGGGSMEKLLGAWQRARGVREDLVIIGKGAHTPHNFPDHIAPQLDQSLDRLKTDYVDLYFLHRDNLDVPVGEFVEVLNAELRRGRIRAFGGSNWTLARIQAANAYAGENGLVGFSAVSNNFSLARMVEPIWPGVEAASTAEFREYLRAEQIALLPWSSQARGFFTPWADAVRAHTGNENQIITTMQPTAAELQRTWFAPDNFLRRERAGLLAAERGVEMINVALAYVLNQPFPCFPLIGPRQLAETRSCIQAAAIELTPGERAWLNLEQDDRADATRGARQ